ncbi:transposase family protein [Desulfovibrio sp. UCD-KL4C]|uniref:transposase family protein n=1 Tax=Desulfovibrio sp. UCD-KL4C TaxID=2578120 RepID=UPI0025B7F5DB|nr:transposase family protein [Desulfovibrio sp. UCD-KL4C]
MSTNFIYYALALSGYDDVWQDFVAGNVLIYVKPKAKLVECSRCKDRHVIRKGRSERWLRTVPIGIKPIWIIVDVPRVQWKAQTTKSKP